MTLATDDLEPGRLVAAIHDLLIGHGYPPDRVTEWWTEGALSALGGRTPRQAWDNHEYQKVYETIRDAYARSEEVGRRLDADPEHTARQEQWDADLKKRYGG
jgi:hypothetical protein